MLKKYVGIVSDGMKGDALGYYFSTHGYEVKLFEVDEAKRIQYLECPRDDLKIKLKKINGKLVNIKVGEKPMYWVRNIGELAGSNLLIDATADNMKQKQDTAVKLEELAVNHIPILSESMYLLPSDISKNMKENSNFIVTYFFDIEYTNNNVELVAHQGTSVEILRCVKELLREIDFSAFSINECLGYIHNRVGGIGISNLFRLYEEGVITFKELSKYILVTRVKPPHFITIVMADEIKTEMYTLLPLFKSMRQYYGERFYYPRFAEKGFTQENLAEVIASISPLDYTLQDNGSIQDPEVREYDTVFISGAGLIYNNIILQLAKRTSKLCLDANSTFYLELLKAQKSKLYEILSDKLEIINDDLKTKIDLAVDFNFEDLDSKKQRVCKYQSNFGLNVPILINTPIFKIQDLAANSPNPSMVYGIYTQRLYLTNTELVIHPLIDKVTYLSIKVFILSLTRSIIEVKDAHVRPLAMLLYSKMLEGVRVLEDGITDMESIEALGVDDGIFKDIDQIGLPNIIRICEYLKPVYGDIFSVPGLIRKMALGGKCFTSYRE